MFLSQTLQKEATFFYVAAGILTKASSVLVDNSPAMLFGEVPLSLPVDEHDGAPPAMSGAADSHQVARQPQLSEAST